MNNSSFEPILSLEEPVFRIHHPYLSVLFLFLSVTVTGGNLLVVLAVYREKVLRKTVTNHYIVSLAGADLLVGVIVMPFWGVYEVTNRTWLFGTLWCDIWYSIEILACTASVLNLCVISLDRYWAIFDPLNYSSRMTPKRTTLIILAIWTTSLLISFPAMIVSRLFRPQVAEAYKCKMFTSNPSYVVFGSVVCFYGPLAVMMFVYWRIYKAAIKQMKSMKSGSKRLKRISFDRPQVSLRIHCLNNVKEDEDTESLRGRFGKFIHNRSRRIARFTREHKAAKTLGIVLGVFVICWTPFFVSLMLLIWGQNPVTREPELSLKVGEWLGWSNSGMNPIIYVCWSRDFRRAFGRIFSCSSTSSRKRMMRVVATSPNRHAQNNFRNSGSSLTDF